MSEMVLHLDVEKKKKTLCTTHLGLRSHLAVRSIDTSPGYLSQQSPNSTSGAEIFLDEVLRFAMYRDE